MMVTVGEGNPDNECSPKDVTVAVRTMEAMTMTMDPAVVASVTNVGANVPVTARVPVTANVSMAASVSMTANVPMAAAVSAAATVASAGVTRIGPG